MFDLMNMLSPAAGMSTVTEGASDEKYLGSQNTAYMIGTTAIVTTVTSSNIQGGNKITETKCKTSKSSGVPGGDNITPPRSGTIIGSLTNNIVIGKHKQSIASSTHDKTMGDTSTGHVDDDIDVEYTPQSDRSNKVSQLATKGVYKTL